MFDLITDNNGHRHRTESPERFAQSLLESGQIRTALGAMAHLLCTTTIAYYRWWKSQGRPNRGDERSAALPEIESNHWLFGSFTIRCEERFLLSNCQRESYEMLGQIEGLTISTDGGSCIEISAEVNVSSVFDNHLTLSRKLSILIEFAFLFFILQILSKP